MYLNILKYMHRTIPTSMCGLRIYNSEMDNCKMKSLFMYKTHEGVIYLTYVVTICACIETAAHWTIVWDIIILSYYPVTFIIVDDVMWYKYSHNYNHTLNYDHNDPNEQKHLPLIHTKTEVNNTTWTTIIWNKYGTWNPCYVFWLLGSTHIPPPPRIQWQCTPF